MQSIGDLVEHEIMKAGFLLFLAIFHGSIIYTHSVKKSFLKLFSPKD